MDDPQYQNWPDGTRVVFTDEAKASMQQAKGGITPPHAGPDTVYTVRNTDDKLHDVILVETSERYGAYWLQAADPADEPVPPTPWSSPFMKAVAERLAARDSTPLQGLVSGMTAEWFREHQDDEHVVEALEDALDKITGRALHDFRQDDPQPWVRTHRDFGESGRFAAPFESGNDLDSFAYAPRTELP